MWHGNVFFALKRQSCWHRQFAAYDRVGVAWLYITQLFQLTRQNPDDLFIGFCFALKLDRLRVEKINQNSSNFILRLKKVARRSRRATFISCVDHCQF